MHAGWNALTSSHLRQCLASYWLTLFITLAALVLQAVGHVNCDVSWQITLAEKYLDGAIPYIDITDPNPPLAFMSLLPPIMAARAFDVVREPILVIYVFLFAFASILLCGAVLKIGAARSRDQKRILLNGALFLFLMTPAFAFGQREQLALFLMAPMFLLMAMREESGRPSLALSATVGGLAGTAIGFKPFYVIPLIIPLAEMCWRRRSIAGLFTTENFSAAAGAGVQMLGILIFFPAYVSDQLPGVLRVYSRIRLPWTQLILEDQSVLTILSLAILAFLMHRKAEERATADMSATSRVCALAAVGFLLTFFLQGKGWINHAYPAVAMALFAWIFAFVDMQPRASENRRRTFISFVVALGIALTPMLFLAHAHIL